MGPVLWCVGTLNFFRNSPVCGPCVVVCGDFEFFQSSSVCGQCGPFVVVCMDFDFSKFLVCVGPVLWCVETLRFSSPPVYVKT